ncbi:MAG TPA: family 1 glycosylhydrolase [Roseiflexaceae bacterium]|nr:family 1 glycosylhydrolase [Roseiflexaceae bacterium]
MSIIRLGLAPEDFVWASGIEDTFVPQTRPGHRALDEYALIGHYDHWRSDLALARDLGVQALRWGIPWYRVEPQPGVFDWRWTDEVLPYMVQELGIAPILDLMHYGCPFWLAREFDNPDYPARVATYAAAVAERYKDLVQWYTPLNEPVMNAWMCGQRGAWPPYLKGDHGYARLMLQLADGIQQTVAAIKAIDPQAVMVHVEVAGRYEPATPADSALAEMMNLRTLLCFDLLAGRVTPAHPLWFWLLAEGAPAERLAAIQAAAIPLDVVGLNFYPQWGTKAVGQNRAGQRSYRPIDKSGSGFVAMIAGYYERYGTPIMITETSARGADQVRAAWLDHSLDAIGQLRSAGVPVIGYTWFPMFTMVNWSYRFGAKPWQDYRLELGMYRLNEENSAARWSATPLVAQFQQRRAHPATSIGHMPQLTTHESVTQQLEPER